MPHLIAFVSGHGYGHAAQTLPLLGRWQRRYPQQRITVVADLPTAVVTRFFAGPVAHVRQAFDFGMCMHDAVRVDARASVARYRRMQREQGRMLEDLSALLTRLRADRVLTNMASLPLLAARQLRLPAVALGSLNWADILHGYVANADRDLVAWLREHYLCADALWRTRPGMPMAWWQPQRQIGPLARIGQPDAGWKQRLGWSADCVTVLVAMGGIAMPVPWQHWPQRAGVCYLLPDDCVAERADVRGISQAGLDFPDLLASVDVVMTKPGYGTMTEAVCHASRVLYLPRRDWPEEPYLLAWLHRHGTALAMDAAAYAQDPGPAIAALMQQKQAAAHPASGQEEGLALLTAWLAPA